MDFFSTRENITASTASNIIVRTFFRTKKKIEVMKEQLKSEAIIKIKEQLHFCAQKNGWK